MTSNKVENVSGPNFEKIELIPVIAQDHASGDVLMLAYMNEVAYRETLQTGRVCYYSRSRQKLRRKGEETGNVQILGGGRFETIQDAVDAAPDGSTITVGEGCYDESLVIDKPITLQGTDRAQVVITGGGDGSAVAIESVIGRVLLQDMTVFVPHTEAGTIRGIRMGASTDVVLTGLDVTLSATSSERTPIPTPASGSSRARAPARATAAPSASRSAAATSPSTTPRSSASAWSPTTAAPGSWRSRARRWRSTTPSSTAWAALASAPSAAG